MLNWLFEGMADEKSILPCWQLVISAWRSLSSYEGCRKAEIRWMKRWTFMAAVWWIGALTWHRVFDGEEEGDQWWWSEGTAYVENVRDMNTVKGYHINGTERSKQKQINKRNKTLMEMNFMAMNMEHSIAVSWMYIHKTLSFRVYIYGDTMLLCPCVCVFDTVCFV